ncbi:MAG: alpha-L-fucosidase [Clostridia bacterium]|nr:alpha-L-fucosidase [Clostridia bacterium]
MSKEQIAENKFGLFIHWGLYSMLGLHEQAQARYNIDRKEYEELATKFNPVAYAPEEWVLLAKKAGMKYICFTTKHHDGFCLWDTKYTDYNIMNTPYGKDVLKMLAEACKKHGILLSLYYSNPDWHHPDAYNEKSMKQWIAHKKENNDLEIYRTYIKNQITELLSNYGEIYTLFWDIPPEMEDKSINALVRQLQPNILINDRGFDKGDFSTPEREFDGLSDAVRFTRMTEACNSVGKISWGYREREDFYSLRHLTYSIDKIMAMGGSYLLNIGPKADGAIDELSREKIEKIGDWYQRMKGCLEGHTQDFFEYEIVQTKFLATQKNGKSYFHFCLGLDANGLIFLKYPSIPKQVVLLNTNEKLKFEIIQYPCFKREIDGFVLCDALHIVDIPVDKLETEPIVLEIEW